MTEWVSEWHSLSISRLQDMGPKWSILETSLREKYCPWYSILCRIRVLCITSRCWDIRVSLKGCKRTSKAKLLIRNSLLTTMVLGESVLGWAFLEQAKLLVLEYILRERHGLQCKVIGARYIPSVGQEVLLYLHSNRMLKELRFLSLAHFPCTISLLMAFTMQCLVPRIVREH